MLSPSRYQCPAGCLSNKAKVFGTLFYESVSGARVSLSGFCRVLLKEMDGFQGKRFPFPAFRQPLFAEMICECLSSQMVQPLWGLGLALVKTYLRLHVDWALLCVTA